MVRLCRSYRFPHLALLAIGLLVFSQAGIQARQTTQALLPKLAGELDTTFGTDGKVVTPLPGSHDSARALVIQPDGKIVAAGFFTPPTSSDSTGQNPVIVRYNSDGSVDTSFGTNGIASLNFTPSQFSGSQLLAITALALQSNGGIVAGGPTLSPNNFEIFGVVRFSSTGVLDTTFGDHGLATATFNSLESRLDALAVGADGKIAAVGADFSAFQQATSPLQGSLQMDSSTSRLAQAE